MLKCLQGLLRTRSRPRAFSMLPLQHSISHEDLTALDRVRTMPKFGKLKKLAPSHFCKVRMMKVDLCKLWALQELSGWESSKVFFPFQSWKIKPAHFYSMLHFFFFNIMRNLIMQKKPNIIVNAKYSHSIFCGILTSLLWLMMRRDLSLEITRILVDILKLRFFTKKKSVNFRCHYFRHQPQVENLEAAVSDSGIYFNV